VHETTAFSPPAAAGGAARWRGSRAAGTHDIRCTWRLDAEALEEMWGSRLPGVPRHRVSPSWRHDVEDRTCIRPVEVVIWLGGAFFPRVDVTALPVRNSRERLAWTSAGDRLAD
jgi:hypothetical protein